jgi:hypothetical protein
MYLELTMEIVSGSQRAQVHHQKGNVLATTMRVQEVQGVGATSMPGMVDPARGIAQKIWSLPEDIVVATIQGVGTFPSKCANFFQCIMVQVASGMTQLLKRFHLRHRQLLKHVNLPQRHLA